MQLGIRLHDTKKLPFEERIANVHELGFACGHLAPGWGLPGSNSILIPQHPPDFLRIHFSCTWQVPGSAPHPWWGTR